MTGEYRIVPILHSPNQEASQGVTHGVIEQESAEAIVGVNRRRAEHEAGKE
ncbi:MAG: hypothetical protein PHT49_10340 [Desulfovibrionales bacterium]|nr:hypothetical protein [Desulfovibrionales bacterium]